MRNPKKKPGPEKQARHLSLGRPKVKGARVATKEKFWKELEQGNFLVKFGRKDAALPLTRRLMEGNYAGLRGACLHREAGVISFYVDSMGDLFAFNQKGEEIAKFTKNISWGEGYTKIYDEQLRGRGIGSFALKLNEEAKRRRGFTEFYATTAKLSILNMLLKAGYDAENLTRKEIRAIAEKKSESLGRIISLKKKTIPLPKAPKDRVSVWVQSPSGGLKPYFIHRRFFEIAPSGKP